MTSRPPPRPHHLRFKYALVTCALTRPRELVARASSPGGLDGLWTDAGADLAEDARCDGSGLAVQNLGDAARPVLMFFLPPPENPNEAYYLWAVPRTASRNPNGSLFVPDPAGELELRMFGMERSMLPDGSLIGFVVEWTATERLNYDAPDDGSPGAFWRAIIEIVGGTRRSIHATALSGSS